MTDHQHLAALHAIRDVELEMAGRIDAARAAADEILRRARAEERAALAAAEQKGRAEADRRLAAAIDRAESDAADIRAAGATRVEDLHRGVEDHLDAVVDELVDLVLAPPLEESS